MPGLKMADSAVLRDRIDNLAGKRFIQRMNPF